MKYTQSLYRLLIYSNTWVALSLVSFTYFISRLFGTVTPSSLVLNFSLAYLAYNYMHWNTFIFHPQKLNKNKRIWMSKNTRIILTTTLATAFTSIYLYLKLPHAQKITVTAVGVLSLMYIFPAKPNRGLRWIPVFKVFLIVSIWSTMAFIPFINSWPSLHHNILIFVTFWIYIFALTILFDIQDMNTDAYHLRTIPQLLGVQNTIRLSQGCLIIVALLFIYLKSQHLITINYVRVALFNIALAIYTASRLPQNNTHRFFELWLESLPIAAGLSVWLLTLI